MTVQGQVFNIANTSTKADDPVKDLLDKLMTGEPVLLGVNDPRLPKKSRIPKPCLIFTPFMDGQTCKAVLISMPGYGSEMVVRGSSAFRPLSRVGLTASLAKALAIELDLAFKRGK